MNKPGVRTGLKQAAIALAIAFGARVAWWSAGFDPLMLLMYGVLLVGFVGLFVLYREAVERREMQWEQDEERH